MRSASNQRMSSTRVVEASVSEEDDSQSDGGEGGVEMEDQDQVVPQKVPSELHPEVRNLGEGPY